jgi:hypothetical protein
MNMAHEILARIHACGGSAFISGPFVKLRSRHPLPPDLVAEVREHKADLMALLQNEEGLESTGATVFEFRLKYHPQEWAVYLAPCTLADARRSLRDRFGKENILAVRRHISPTTE